MSKVSHSLADPEMYGTEVSPDLICKVTDEVMAEVTAWQSRPLEPMYPVVFFDALWVKIRDDAVIRNKAVHLRPIYAAATACAPPRTQSSRDQLRSRQAE